VQPHVDAQLHVVEEHPARVRARDEQDEPDHQVRDAPGRDPDHHHEDPEVQERGAEVSLHEQDREGCPPGQEHRSQVLGGRQPERAEAGGRDPQQLTLLVQVRGQEDDDQDLADLGRLEAQRPDLHPQAGAVDRLPDPGDHRQQEEDQTEQADRVGEGIEHPVVADHDQRRGERQQPHPDPRGLFGREAAGKTEDHGEPQPDQHPGGGEQRGVRARSPSPDHHEGAQVPDHEDGRVQAERRRQSVALPVPRDHVSTHGQDERQHHEGDRRRERGPIGPRRRPAHGPSARARATSTRICSTIASAASRSSAVIPSSRSR
jgi:hypothetical protein